MALFSSLFPSKIEKELKEWCIKAPKIEVRYPGNEQATVSEMLKVFHDSIMILGFTEGLRNPELEIRILGNMVTFKTRVLKQGLNQAGNTVYNCSIPTKLIPPPANLTNLYQIHPHGTIRALLSTNRGERSLSLQIWEIGAVWLSILVPSGMMLKPGTKLFQAMISIGGSPEQLTDLTVFDILKGGPASSKGSTVARCIYVTPPKNLSELVSQAKSLAPKPQQAKK